MASIRLEGVFPAGREVSFIPRKSHEMHVGAKPVAIAAVGSDSVLQIDGLDPGRYWAVAAGQQVAVKTKGKAEGAGAVESEPRDTDAIDEAPDPAPNHPKEIVTGARTSANARSSRRLKAAPKAPREPRAPRK